MRDGILAFLRRQLLPMGAALAALVIGLAVALASSPGSLAGRHPYAGVASPRPSPIAASPSAPPAPTPTLATIPPGVLGAAPDLKIASQTLVLAASADLTEFSSDGGKTWTAISLPPKGLHAVVDPSDPRHLIVGGDGIQVSTDGGSTWRPARANPPGLGPYRPLQISPFDGQVWFLVHQQQVLRTRDGSATWRDLPVLPPSSNPVLVAGLLSGQFFAAAGNRVFELDDNGQQIVELPPLPDGTQVSDLAVVQARPASMMAKVGAGSTYLLKDGAWSSTGAGLHGPVAVGQNGRLLVGDGGARVGSAAILKYSDDSGATWITASGLPGDQSVEAIASQRTGPLALAYCFGGDLYSSSDGGATWALLSKAFRSQASP